MKAKEYIEKYDGDIAKIGIALFLEIEKIAKTRSVFSNIAMASIVTEQNQKWNAVLRKLGEVENYNFLIFVISKVPELIEYLPAVKK